MLTNLSTGSRGETGWPVLAGATTAVVAAVAVFFMTADRPLWLDEAWSANLAGQSPGAILRGLASDNGPPLYYLILAAWSRLFGNTEVALRGLSLAFHLTTAVLIGLAASRAGVGRAAAIVGALAWLVSPPALMYATTVRMYSLLGLLVAASCALLLEGLRNPKPRTLAMWACATMLGLLTHYWFAFVVIGQGAAWLVLRRGDGFLRLVVAGACAVGAFAALWGPSFYGQLGNGSAAWLPRPDLLDVGRALADYVGGGPEQSSWWAVGVAVVLAACVFAVRRRSTDSRRHAAALAAAGLVTLLVPFVMSYLQPMFLVGRYTLAALPIFALAIAHALRGGEPRWAAGVMLAVQLTTGPWLGLARVAPYAAIDDRLAAQLIATKAAPHDAVVATMLSGPTVFYSLDQFDAAVTERVTFPAELAEHPAWADAAALQRALGQIEREAASLAESLGDRPRKIFVVYGHYNDVGAALVRELGRRYRSLATIPFAGSTFNMVLVYDTSTPLADVERRVPATRTRPTTE